MTEISPKMPVIRIMTSKDLDRIVEIDTKVLGQSRTEYWEMKLELAEKHSPMSSLVAKLDGEVVGFVQSFFSIPNFLRFFFFILRLQFSKPFLESLYLLPYDGQ